MGVGAAGDAERFWTELGELYRSAGDEPPSLNRLVALAKSNGLTISRATVQEWLTGKSVPGNENSVRYYRILVEYLQQRARRHPGYQMRPPGHWDELLLRARTARDANRGGRPPSRTAAGPDERREEPLSRVRAAVLLTPEGKLPRVGQIDMITLGVHRAAQVGKEAGETPNSPAAQPAYVPRDCDARLAEALSRGGLVIVEGRSASGKSRAAAEAMSRVAPDRWLLAPRDGPALQTLVEHADGVRNAVVWLDNLERFHPGGHLTAYMLNRLCPPGRTDVVVLATLRAEERHNLEAAHPAPGRWATPPAQPFLELATTIRLPFQTSETERRAAKRHRQDPRIAQWLDRGQEAGLPEYLAAGPAALRRWLQGQDGDHLVGAALVSAAVDCRRAQHGKPVSRGLLVRMYPHYLDPRDAGRVTSADVQDGFVWATQLVRGASSCLIPRGSDGYETFDYLVDHVQREGAQAPPIPEPVWHTVLEHVSGDDLSPVITAALRTVQPEIQDFALNRMGQDRGFDAVWEWVSAVLILSTVGDYKPRYIRWLRPYAEAGHPVAMGMLGYTLVEDGAADDGEAWLRRAAESGDQDSALQVFALLSGRGDAAGLERWAKAELARGHGTAALAYGTELARQGRKTEAEVWFVRAAEAGHPAAGNYLGDLHLERGDSEEARTWYEKSAEAGWPKAMTNLGFLHQQQGAQDTAEQWYERAAEAGDPLGMFNYARVMQLRGEDQEAEGWYRRAAEQDVVDAMYNLGKLLERTGRTEEARAWYRRAAHQGDVDATVALMRTWRG